MSAPGEEATRPPLLRVVHGGEPTPDEVAALVAVVLARTGAEEEPPGPLRKSLPAWVASGLVKGTRTRA